MFVVSGDNGAYVASTKTVVPGGAKAVNGLASTPFNIAVGGTTLSDASAYWNPDNSTYGVSALGYIPEAAWNNWGLQNGGSIRPPEEGPPLFGANRRGRCAPGVPNNGARRPARRLSDADPYTGYRIYTCTNYTGAVQF